MPNILSVFWTSKNTFKSELPGEKTILVVRRHWFFLFLSIFFILFLALLPFIFYFFIRGFSWYNIFSSLYWFLVTIYFLILWLLLFYSLTIYILTTLVLTNLKLIKIEQKTLFNYERDEMELDKIQDISVNISGFFATFLNFGDISVQTAGTIAKFSFNYLSQPHKIKEIIMSLK